MDKVSLVIGSSSDWQAVKEACLVWHEFVVPFEIHVLSAHRTPELLRDYLAQATDAQVYVAAAGGAAHLAGVIASQVVKPVIALPVSSAILGLDSLLSMVQMPAGVPVATVGINAAKNAALLAIQMLAIGNKTLEHKLYDYRQKQVERIKNDNDKVNSYVKELLSHTK